MTSLAKTAEDYFLEDSAWIVDKVRDVQESQQPEVIMDRLMSFNGENHSVNASILPLVPYSPFGSNK